MASDALVRDATIERSGYWQAMRWCEMRQLRGAGIGKQCAGARGDNRGEWVLASNVLVQDVTRRATYRVISVTLQEWGPE